ncbi:thioredoxin [Anaerolineae bacterium CFX9]|jgi:thioredoxin 1|nr:thioredoxin [Anaerolineae bacterium CFX9]
MSNAQAVTEATFESDVLKSDLPVLVDFWAEWCGPCRMIAPYVDQIAAEQTGKLKVVKIDTDENIAIAQNYGIQSLPTLMLFKGGEPVARVVGFVPKDRIMSQIAQHLG